MKNWKRGITLLTPQTKMWSDEEIKRNDKIEQTMVFSNFFNQDKGCGRLLVCTLNENNPDYNANAKLIEAAPELLEACLEFVRKVECGEAKSKRSYAQMKAAIKKVY